MPSTNCTSKWSTTWDVFCIQILCIKKFRVLTTMYSFRKLTYCIKVLLLPKSCVFFCCFKSPFDVQKNAYNYKLLKTGKAKKVSQETCLNIVDKLLKLLFIFRDLLKCYLGASKKLQARNLLSFKRFIHTFSGYKVGSTPEPLVE